jgi:hypothetical protein
MSEANQAPQQTGDTGQRVGRSRWLPWILASLLASLLLVSLLLLGLLLAGRHLEASGRAPEADRVLRAQSRLPFQVLIPAYLPAGFDREGADVSVSGGDKGQAGKASGQAARISYRNRLSGAMVFISEWVPISPTLETLVGAQPIETKWGRGQLLANEDSGFSTLWADLGGLRVAVESPRSDQVSPEIVLAIVNSLGPAANQQVSSRIAEKPVIHSAAPLPPVRARLNAQGIQEVTLVATAAGYSPARFAVSKGVPVRLTFRELGDAACAAQLIFPTTPSKTAQLVLKSVQDQKIVEFTPLEAGDFTFHCIHDIYKGVMSVD